MDTAIAHMPGEYVIPSGAINLWEVASTAVQAWKPDERY